MNSVKPWYNSLKAIADAHSRAKFNLTGSVRSLAETAS
jgi:hypothetical protein